MKGTRIIMAVMIGFFLIAGYGLAETGTAQKTAKSVSTKSEIHNRKDFDTYLTKFNARDYQGFLAYYADKFEMIHVGGNLKSREEVMKFYNFLHAYVKETVIVDRLVMDKDTIAMEARVRIEGIKDMTPEAIAASGYTRLKPLKVGQAILIPQFIHYHIVNGKFTKVECKE